MPEKKSQYPNFDVMHGEKHWDGHTREIVQKRLRTDSFYPYRVFTQQEADTLYSLCSILLDDIRQPIIAYVVHHFDSTLKASLGESQRKIGVPPQSALIRDGLALLDQACVDRYGEAFPRLESHLRKQIVKQLMQGKLALPSSLEKFPATEWMDKILIDAAAAYYSHPSVWSEIGYAGPAYPRGYVRTEMGLTDPWEAKRDGQ